MKRINTPRVVQVGDHAPGYSAELVRVDDDEFGPCCVVCGQELEWDDCYEVGCDEGQIDLYEEDAINYAPGETEPCSTCAGEGGWWHCPNIGNHASSRLFG